MDNKIELGNKVTFTLTDGVERHGVVVCDPTDSYALVALTPLADERELSHVVKVNLVDLVAE